MKGKILGPRKEKIPKMNIRMASNKLNILPPRDKFSKIRYYFTSS